MTVPNSWPDSWPASPTGPGAGPGIDPDHKADPRPAAVTVGYWLLLAGSVLLIAGGALTIATVSFDLLRQVAPASVPDASVRSYLLVYRGVGVLFAVAGLVLAALAVRVRRRDARYRRAAIALALAIVLLVGVAVLFGLGFSILVLLSLLPIIVGVLMLNRAAAIGWFFPGYPTGSGA